MPNRQDILELNQKQRDFYNSESPYASAPARLWSSIRNGWLSRFRNRHGFKSLVYDEHRRWLGDLSNQKVLDLGCLRGNALSLYMAERAREYVAIDLSDNAIAQLSEKLEPFERENVRAVAVDFLSDEFEDSDFDLIYAFGVLHHFENLDVLIEALQKKLSPNGRIVTYDPLSTSPLVWLARALFRPFQTDKAWEWPFTRKTVRRFTTEFDTLEMHGVLGYSKWGLLLDAMPLTRSFKDRTIERWQARDWDAKTPGDVNRCMHLTMLLRKSSTHGLPQASKGPEVTPP